MLSSPSAELEREPAGQARVIAVCGVKPGLGATTIRAHAVCACRALLPAAVVVGATLRPARRAAEGKRADKGDENVEPLVGLDAPSVSRALGRLRTSADIVVVDLPVRLSERVLAVLDAADTVLIVVRLDVGSIRGAQRVLRTFRALGYPDEKLKVVVNRYRDLDPLGVSDATRALRHPVFWRIPEDLTVPRAGGAASAAIFRAVLSLVAALLGVALPETVGEGATDLSVPRSPSPIATTALRGTRPPPS
jgi:hypothetical protein